MIDKTVHIGPSHKRQLTLLHVNILKHHHRPRTRQYNDSAACREYTQQLVDCGAIAPDHTGAYAATEDGRLLYWRAGLRISKVIGDLV